MIKGKLLTLCVRKKTKSRQANSSIGYFEINGKAIVPYDLKHYLRVTCYHSPSESFAPEHQMFEAPWSPSGCNPLELKNK